MSTTKKCIACFVVGGLACAAGILLGRQPWRDARAPSPDRPTARAPAPATTAGPAATLPVFTDIRETAGVRFTHTNGRTNLYRYPELMGAGVALFDYDADGWLDIYFINGNRLLDPPDPAITNVVYRNNGDGTFTDTTDATSLGDAGYGQGVCIGDYDGDGDLDCYVTNFGPDRLFRNNGDGTFTDDTQAAGVDNPGWGQACVFFDYDNDGTLDLYVQNYLTYSLGDPRMGYALIDGRRVHDYVTPRVFNGAADLLYKNNGDGTFTDATEAAGVLRPAGRGMGLAAFDFDDDGDTDLFVANDAMENFFFVNNGDATFTESAVVLGVAFNGNGLAESSMGVALGDTDGGSKLDLLVPTIRLEGFTLYRNSGAFFLDASTPTGLFRATARHTGFSPNFLDFDNDGDLDLFVTCGSVLANESAAPDAPWLARYGQPDLLLLNDGQGHFRIIESKISNLESQPTAADSAPAARPSAIRNPQSTIRNHFQRALIARGSAAGDLDNDGDLDLVINNLEGPAVLLRNDTRTDHHWLTLDLHPAPGHALVGTRITLTAAGKTQTRLIQSSAAYLSVNDPRPHFGLGQSSTVDQVAIHWAAGTTQTVSPLRVDQVLTIRERAP